MKFLTVIVRSVLKVGDDVFDKYLYQRQKNELVVRRIELKHALEEFGTE